MQTLQDLKVGMKLEGMVTNVTAFGAFVDVGVHQDGLIHLSELSDRYIKHPSEVVKAGDKINVEVLQVNIEQKRISLTAKIGRPPQIQNQLKEKLEKGRGKQQRPDFKSNPFANL